MKTRFTTFAAAFLALLAIPTLYTVALGNNAGSTGAGTYLAQTTVEAGDTHANSTDETQLASMVRIAAGEMNRVGVTRRFCFGGTLSAAATPPTLNLTARSNPVAGATPGGVVLWSSTATTLPSGGLTSVQWSAVLYLTCVVTGASGTANVVGWCQLGTTDAAAPQVGATPVTGTVAVDWTIANTVGISFDWSAANASNTITQRYAFAFLGN